MKALNRAHAIKGIICALFATWLIGLIGTGPLTVRAYHEKDAFEKRIRKFWAAFQSNDLERAYWMTSVDFKKATPFEVFQRQGGELATTHGELKSIAIGHYEIGVEGTGDDWTGVAGVTLNFESKTLLFDVSLKKESGRWKILDYGPP